MSTKDQEKYLDGMRKGKFEEIQVSDVEKLRIMQGQCNVQDKTVIFIYDWINDHNPELQNKLVEDFTEKGGKNMYEEQCDVILSQMKIVRPTMDDKHEKDVNFIVSRQIPEITAIPIINDVQEFGVKEISKAFENAKQGEPMTADDVLTDTEQFIDALSEDLEFDEETKTKLREITKGMNREEIINTLNKLAESLDDVVYEENQIPGKDNEPEKECEEEKGEKEI